MAEAPPPKIKVTDPQTANQGRGSPSLTDGGYSSRPRSVNSSEANTQSIGKPATLPQSPSGENGSYDTEGSNDTSSRRPSTAVEPVSRLLKKPTNTGSSQLQTSPAVESPAGESTGDDNAPSRQLTSDISRADGNPNREKKKGVSFLSRFSIIGGKKKEQADVDDDESEIGDQRPEGMNAHVFSSSIGANGYIPQHKVPPRYIKVRAHNKKPREFNRIFLAQELSYKREQPASDEKVPGLTTTEEVPAKLTKLPPKTSGAVWSTEFSKDGRYLAAGGRDQVVRVWAVISTPEERQSHEHDEDGERLSAPVFRSKPIREFEGHTGDILDLSWSKNNFLLSSSMDKTVRLWHISRQECLCTFRHKDFVTSIAFHPTDDRFFLAGSIDSVLRLWSIPDKSVAFWNHLPDLITAVAFTPDGKSAMAGVLSGLCLFYETEGLKYHTQIHVRSSRGKNAKGSKITGIRTINSPPDDPDGEIKVLITSNDSRVRVYNLRDKSLEMKFKGHENSCSQINASFSDCGQYVICGSEDRKAYIWSAIALDAENKDKRPLELFEAHSEMVTAAVIAPTNTRRLLSSSGDPIYDLCNPPPITLMSREETNASSIPQGSDPGRKTSSANEHIIKKPEESPAYIARTTHMSGHIIITADFVGNIKVFRQDCAYFKRRQDNWETNSSFSKKMLGRSGSIATKGSGGSYSRRDSISQSSLPSAGIQSSDQILSWRNSVTSTTSLENSPRNNTLPSRGDRSVSPGKLNKGAFQYSPVINVASAARQQPYSGTPLAKPPSIAESSPPQSIHKVPSPNASQPASTQSSQPPTPGFVYQNVDDEEDQLKVDSAGKSYSFWNIGSWKNQLMSSKPPNMLGDNMRPEMARGGSVVSKLSSDEESSESEDEVVACKKCGGTDFRARKVAGKPSKLVCTKCMTVAD